MFRFTTAIFALCAATVAWSAETVAPPVIDNAKLDAYIRYAEAFSPAVKLAIGAPAKTVSPDLWSVPVHITLGNQSLDRTYYVTADGQELLGSAKLWTLNGSPFSETIALLPKDGPTFGPENAKVTVTVFSDFECPYCRQLAQTVRQNLPKAYPNQVRVVYADFPLQSIHPWAHDMAEAAHCVAGADDSRFWALHDWIFEHQGEITKETLKDKILGYAKDQKLDSDKINTCINTHATAAIVDRDLQLGKQLGVDQTPVVFVNGRMLAGAQQWPTLDAVIKLDLERNKGLSESTVGKSQ